MSFSGTPLGQGRRLDHHTFLNKPPSTNRPPSPQRTSYAYGAPTLGSRSPPKPSSSSRDLHHAAEDDTNEHALARFTRLKEQREQSFKGSAPKLITSPPHPEKWSVKDTSVNIASAFHQAVNTSYDMQPNNPNNSWASGSRTNVNVPRSTSVEYEKETQSTSTRRLAAPPNRLAPRTAATRKPLSKSTSIRHVPDSEGEEENTESVGATGRAKSPFDQLLDVGRRAFSPATFYLRQRSQEPEEPPVDQQTQPTNGKDASYDYSAEEREVQAAQNQRAQAPASRRASAPHKRGRMSTDNKAYRPSMSDLDDSDGDFDDDGKKIRRRKGRKKEPMGGPLTTLPVTSYDKKKKRKSKGSKENIAGTAEDEEESSDDQAADQEMSQQMSQRASVSRAGSVTRNFAPPPPQYETSQADESYDIEQGLDSIPEISENEEAVKLPPRARSRSRPPASEGFSIGALMGKFVNWLARTIGAVLFFAIQLLSMATLLMGRVLGTAFDVILNRPLHWLTHANPGPLLALGKYFLIAFTILAAWSLRDPLLGLVSRSSSSPTYSAPELPAANIAELSTRLQQLESALSGLSQQVERSRSHHESELQSLGELSGRVGTVESRVQKESTRAVEAEIKQSNLVSQGLRAVKHDLELVQAQMVRQQERERDRAASHSETVSSGNDDEARAMLKALDERVGSVEGGVKEALELGRQSSKSGSGGASAWWHKLASGSSSNADLTIKSSDGQDVTGLIRHLVDSAVTTHSKDTLARPDYALHSGGARIVPSLTSPTFEIRPAGLGGTIVGLVTGNGYAIGRPPITALHHELHNGHCWPFAGSEGQLGVALAAPTFIEDVTIDHVAKEVAFDMRSAPREMELWALVEGKENIEKVDAWLAEKARRLEEAKEKGELLAEEEGQEYPNTLPKSARYLRIASFEYDIHAPHHVQTFPVLPEIKELHVDFGVVALRVKSNWGREFTCLYRFRVHGERMGDVPSPGVPEELD